MNTLLKTCRILTLSGTVTLLLMSCHSAEKPAEKDPVVVPEKMEVRVHANLQKWLPYALENNGRLNDSITLALDTLVNLIYEKNDFKPVWSRQEEWSALGDSLFAFIARSKDYGLFPSDYHFRALNSTRMRIDSDSVARRDAALWTSADIMLTDAFLLIGRHLKRGRLPYDSVTLRTDSILPVAFYSDLFQQLQTTRNVAAVLNALEPAYPAYDSLKLALHQFLDSVKTFKRYTLLSYPVKDSMEFYKLLQRRLFEGDLVTSPTDPIDTARWREIITQYQQSHRLRVTGKPTEGLVNSLNNTEWEKFKQVAVNLDRYKLLPDTLPETYLWVNIPSYTLKVVSDDTVSFESRVIVGTSKTRTPLLTSAISNFITYPQWTVPQSIIFKEMLPAIKRNVGYLDRQNLMIVDRNDSVLNPYTINWARFSKTYFPYQIKQRQGDDNSLGVIKFNFPNKYSVYLHDTNARWLFAQSNRSLSHGCVRVKEWQKLSDFLIRNDTMRYHPDTLRNWLKRQEKHVVWGFKKLPVYIRYFTAEAKEGRIKFFDDIYGEDRTLKQRYFADKSIQ